MKANIVVQGVESDASLRARIIRRLDFALKHCQGMLRGVVIRLADANGPRGGVDKVCSVQLSLPGQRPVIVTEKHAVLEHAIDRAIHRAAQSVTRRLARLRKPAARGKAPARDLFLAESSQAT